MKFNQIVRDGFSRIARLKLGEEEFLTPAVIPFEKLERFVGNTVVPLSLKCIDAGRFEKLRKEDENFLVFNLNINPNLLNPTPNQSPSSSQFEVMDLLKDFVISGVLEGRAKPVYAPAVDAFSIPVLAYMGIDVFDTISAEVAAEKDFFMLDFSSFKASELKENPCSCRICCENGTEVLKDKELLREHNVLVMERRAAMTRELIRRGELRNFIESEVKKSPFYTALLRLFDSNWEERHPHPRFRKSRAIFCSQESFNRPEVSYFLKRSAEIYSPKTGVAVVLPCSAKKPYMLSRSHRMLRSKVDFSGVNEVIVSSPLVTPRELELCYPACNYDVAVTGYWSTDEVEFVSEKLARLLEKFEVAIAYLSGGYRRAFERACEIAGLDGIVAESPEELGRLVEKYREERFDLYMEIFRHMFRYQFGREIDDSISISENMRVRGKYPELELYTKNAGRRERIARIDFPRGCLDVYDVDLVLKSGYRVRIDEFKPRGTVFAAGVVEAWEGIKPGDLVAFENESWKGIGVARMSGVEMEKFEEGYAIDVKRVTERIDR